MSDTGTQSDRRNARVHRIAREALRHAKGHDGWRAYEAAKRYVRREYGPHVACYDEIIDAITDRLEI